MYKITEQGRSMIEMLGVLAIIGVLSIGGLQVVSRMQHEHKMTQLVNDFMEYVTFSNKMACQYDTGYSQACGASNSECTGRYDIFLYKNNSYPQNWSFGMTSSTPWFYGVLNTKYKSTIKISDEIVNQINLYAYNLDDESCINLAILDFGGLRVSGVTINGTPPLAGQKHKQLTINQASGYCNKGEQTNKNYVKFIFSGCN